MNRLRAIAGARIARERISFIRKEEPQMRATARNGLISKPDRAPATQSLASLEASARRFLFEGGTINRQSEPQ